jgi:hypothetical protein
MAGSRVKYTLATKLVNELVEAADDLVLTKTIARYGRVDLLCIDELGYMELDRRGAELLFQALTEREKKASVAIASNESFPRWLDQDVRCPAALRCHRRSAHLRRQHHRDRHRVLPPHPQPPSQGRSLKGRRKRNSDYEETEPPRPARDCSDDVSWIRSSSSMTSEYPHHRQDQTSCSRPTPARHRGQVGIEPDHHTLPTSTDRDSTTITLALLNFLAGAFPAPVTHDCSETADECGQFSPTSIMKLAIECGHNR